MHKVSAANSVKEPSYGGQWGVGKPVAHCPVFGWLRLAAPCEEALPRNPNFNGA